MNKIITILTLILIIPFVKANDVEVIVADYHDLGENIDIYVKNNLDEPIYYFDGCFKGFEIYGPLEEGSSTGAQINRPWEEECDAFMNTARIQFEEGLNEPAYRRLLRNPFFMFFLRFKSPFKESTLQPGETKLIHVWDQKAYVRMGDKKLDERDTVIGNNYFVKFNYARNVKHYGFSGVFSNILMNLFLRGEGMILDTARSDFLRIGTDEPYEPIELTLVKLEYEEEVDLEEAQRRLQEMMESGTVIRLPGEVELVKVD